MAIIRVPSPKLRGRSVSFPRRRTPATPLEPPPRRVSRNFAALSAAELFCRGTSIVVNLFLMKTLGTEGFGRIAFAFYVVLGLVLLVRDGFEVIGTRELARHPRLVRPLVNHVLAVRGLLAVGLFASLVAVSFLTLSEGLDRAILALYGLLLLTTASGLDFVYRGTERMGLVAASLCVRTSVYALGVWCCVSGASRIVGVPLCLALGEACGIALVWACYARSHGLPRPVLGNRFLVVFLRRGRSVCLIQVLQTIISSSDFLVVGLMTPWADLGRYGASHQVVMALLTFGLVFQQVVFPTLARSWRQSAADGRQALDHLVVILVIFLVPMTVGGALLASPLVRFVLPAGYAGSGLLLALGIWRAPLLTLAFLYQTTLIAVNRESAGLRLLVGGAAVSVPLVAVFCRYLGLPGALAASLLVGLGLLLAGYACLAREGRQPAWHHHLGRPLLAALVMAGASLILVRWHVLAAVGGGAIVYFGVLAALGGLPFEGLKAIFGDRCRRNPPPS